MCVRACVRAGVRACVRVCDQCVTPPGNPTKGKDIEEELDDYWKVTIWLRIAEDSGG